MTKATWTPPQLEVLDILETEGKTNNWPDGSNDYSS